MDRPTHSHDDHSNSLALAVAALERVPRCTVPGCTTPGCSGFHIWVAGGDLDESEEARRARQERVEAAIRRGGGVWMPGIDPL